MKTAVYSLVNWPALRSDPGKMLLFCPIETKAREMDAKTLLACVAAEKGHKAIVGDMAELRSLVEYLPRGVYLSKSIPDKMEKYFRRYRQLGYAVAAWCEEGLVFLSREIYKKKMVSIGALSQADLFFAWGENQARAVIEKAPEAAEKVKRVGNPRIDLLRSPYRGIFGGEAERLRATYGDYILFNTNFAAVNNIISAEYAFEDARKRGKIPSEEDEEHYWKFFDHRRTIFERMTELVGTVSRAFPERRIVVRPHPSENHETWDAVTENLDNVDVVYEGSVVPWLMGASAVIHNGCTTAVEAYMLETPAIAYRPVVEEGLEFELPNSVSVQARSADEVIDSIAFVARNDDKYRKWRMEAGSQLEHYIADANGAYASDAIIAELERHYAKGIVPESRLHPAARYGKHRVKELLRAVKHAGKTMRNGADHPGDKHRRQKFPDISINEIEALIGQLQHESGRFRNVKASPVAGTRRCFMIEPS